MTESPSTSDGGAIPAQLVYDALLHDLHYRSSTFVPDLSVRRPASLRPALEEFGSRGDVIAQWRNLSFDGIIKQVIDAIGEELKSQRGTEKGFERYLENFQACFTKVEYVVNIRLLHALARVPPTAMHALLSRALRERLPGHVLARTEPGRENLGKTNWFHVAQDDGVFIGDGAVVALELKVGGKTRGTRLGAAQIAKHVWMLKGLEASVAWRHRHLLVLLPANGEGHGESLGCLATDLALSGGRLSIRKPANAPFERFMNRIDRKSLEGVLADFRAPALSFRQFAAHAADVLPSAMANARSIIEDLQKVTRDAQPPDDV